MTDQIDRAERRVHRYWYEDGLGEVATGSVFGLVALLFLIEAAVPARALPPSFSAIGLPIVVTIGILLARWLVAAAKGRLTYPRTGYVAYRQPSTGRRFVSGAVAGLIAVLLVALLGSAPASLAWIPAGEGLVIGGALLYVGHRLDLTRFAVLAACSAVAGVAVALGGLGETLGNGVYFAATGLTLVASGGITLRAYLRQSRPAPEE